MLKLAASQHKFQCIVHIHPHRLCEVIVPTFSEKAQTKMQICPWSPLGHWYLLFILCAFGHKTQNLKFWVFGFTYIQYWLVKVS